MTEVSMEALNTTIDPETRDILEADAEGIFDEIWLKLKPNGFENPDGDIFSELAGKVVEIEPHWIKWEDRKPDRVYTKEKPAEGYEKRCDIKIIGSDGTKYAIGLSKSSYKNFLSYYKKLNDQGLDIGEVITGLHPKVGKGSFGSFTMVNFMLSDVPF